MSRLRLLILGANGFLGKNAFEYFSAKEDFTVLGPTRQELNLLDTAAVEAYFQIARPDVVVLAAVNITSLEENLQIYYNVERCFNLFHKLIVVGSGAEYDLRHYKPMMAENYFRSWVPSDIYGLSKFVVSNDIEKANFPAVNLRLLGVFGKYENYRRRFISNNICRALSGFDISLSQNMRFDYLDVNDFNRILEIFIYNDAKKRNYNICTSRPYELMTLAQIIKKIHGNSATAIRLKAEGMKPEYSASNELFLNEFGPFKFTNIEKSINDLYDWYKKNLDVEEYQNELLSSEVRA